MTTTVTPAPEVQLCFPDITCSKTAFLCVCLSLSVCICVTSTSRQWHHAVSHRRTIEKKWRDAVKGTGQAVCTLPTPTAGCRSISTADRDFRASLSLSKYKKSKKSIMKTFLFLHAEFSGRLPFTQRSPDVSLSEAGNCYTRGGSGVSAGPH